MHADILKAINENESFRLAVCFLYEKLISDQSYGKVTFTGQHGEICDYKSDRNYKAKDLEGRYER